MMNKLLATGLIYLVAIQATLAGPLDTAFDRMNNFNKPDRDKEKLNLHKMVDISSLTLIEQGTETDKYHRVTLAQLLKSPFT